MQNLNMIFVKYPHSRDLCSMKNLDVCELRDSIHCGNDSTECYADYWRKCSLFDQSCIMSEFLTWYEADQGYVVTASGTDKVIVTFWYRHMLDALDFASQAGNTTDSPLAVHSIRPAY